MGPNNEDQVPNRDPNDDRNVDWSKYGLHNTEMQRNPQRNNGSYEEFGSEMYQTGANELFAQEYVSILIGYDNI